MKLLQSCLITLLQRNEITKVEFDLMRSKNSKQARAQGPPKIHEFFSNIPKFRPIIDTTGTIHYSVDKYLASLLYPLTTNDFPLKDSFNLANRIKAVSSYLFENGYQYVSFNVESLFIKLTVK